MSLLCIGLFCFDSVKAEQPQEINLKQALQMALDSNSYIRSSVYDVNVQKALKGAAWDIPKTEIYGHRSFANKTCPGTMFDVELFKSQI